MIALAMLPPIRLSVTKVFFQTLAIADDLVAIVVLALFYGQTSDIAWVAASLIVVTVLAGMARARVILSIWACSCIK